MQEIFVPLSGVFQRITTTSYGNNFSSLVAFGYSGFASGLPINNSGVV